MKGVCIILFFFFYIICLFFLGGIVLNCEIEENLLCFEREIESFFQPFWSRKEKQVSRVSAEA